MEFQGLGFRVEDVGFQGVALNLADERSEVVEEGSHLLAGELAPAAPEVVRLHGRCVRTRQTATAPSRPPSRSRFSADRRDSFSPPHPPARLDGPASGEKGSKAVFYMHCHPRTGCHLVAGRGVARAGAAPLRGGVAAPRERSRVTRIVPQSFVALTHEALVHAPAPAALLEQEVVRHRVQREPGRSKVQGSGVSLALGFRIQVSGFRFQVLWFRVWGLGFRV